jgi:hypothetical protein
VQCQLKHNESTREPVLELRKSQQHAESCVPVRTCYADQRVHLAVHAAATT